MSVWPYSHWKKTPNISVVSANHCQNSLKNIQIYPLTSTLYYLPGQDNFLYDVSLTPYCKGMAIPVLVKYREHLKWKKSAEVLEINREGWPLNVGWTYYTEISYWCQLQHWFSFFFSSSEQLLIGCELHPNCQITFPNRPEWHRQKLALLPCQCKGVRCTHCQFIQAFSL